MRILRLLATSPWNGAWNECPTGDLRCPHGEGTHRAHTATPERVIPGLCVRRNRPAHQAADPPQINGQDRDAGADRARQAFEKARDGRSPEAGVTVAKLLDEYAPIAQWDVSTRQTNEGFIRRTLNRRSGT
jgi:hypothetical protein